MKRIRKAAKTGALKLIMLPEYGDPEQPVNGAQPCQQCGLKSGLFTQQTNDRNGELDTTNNQYRGPEWNAKQGFWQEQHLVVSGSDD